VSEGTAPARFRSWDVLRGIEPPPAAFLLRQSFHPWLVVGIACIGGFMGQVDASIVQLALPALKRAFGVSVDDVRWVAIGYPLAYAACLPVFARVCEIFGRKLVFLLGFAVFTIASLMCGLAQDLGWLIAFRVLQGVGGGMIGANSMVIVVKAVAPDKRARGIALYTTAQAIGVSSGPVIGGLLLDALGWHWVFWVTVPFGLTATIFGWLALPRTADRALDKTLDWHGALLLMPSLVLAILILNQVSVWRPDSPAMIICVIAVIAFLALFVRQERRTACPLIDLALLNHRAFVAGIVGVAFGYALLYGTFFLMSFALVHGLHESARLAGLKLAVIPVAIGLVAPFGAALSERFGSRGIGAAGMALCIAAIAVLSAIAFKPIGTLVSGLSAFAFFGVGLGLFFGPISHATIDAAPASHSGQAAGMINLMRVFGTCIGISIASSMMSLKVERLAGSAGLDGLFEGSLLLEAIESSLVVLAVFALIAAGAALLGPRQAS
jgi:EmrB/QacA subfamily drug resistance transporter